MSNDLPENVDNQYELGNNYFRTAKEDDVNFAKNTTVEKSGDRYTIEFYSVGNGNQRTNHTLVLKEIDISGDFNFAERENQGFYTWVNGVRFDKLPSSLKFPEGSGCFVFEKQTQDRVTYWFDEDDITSYTNIDDYLKTQYQVSDVKRTMIGENNTSELVEFQQANSDSVDYAVLFNGNVYGDVYKNELTEVENTDITKGYVYCEQLNTVAADYVEEQLIQAYQ